jgi:phosphotriesterase-related protein
VTAETRNEMVATACGQVSVSALGRTLVHEHLFVTDAEHALNSVSDAELEVLISAAATKLNEAHAAGIDTVVDATIHGIGRIVDWIVAAAARTQVNVLWRPASRCPSTGSRRPRR